MKNKSFIFSLISLLFSCKLIFAAGSCYSPLLTHIDNVSNEREFQNLYQCINNAVIATVTVGTATISNLKGTTTNNNACVGCVGEYMSSYASAVALTASNAWQDITSLPLTAGDWDVTFISGMNGTGAFSAFGAGVSTVAGNSATGLQDADTSISLTDTIAFPNRDYISLPAIRMSLSVATTVYAKQQATYGGTAPQGRGRISARRIR